MASFLLGPPIDGREPRLRLGSFREEHDRLLLALEVEGEEPPRARGSILVEGARERELVPGPFQSVHARRNHPLLWKYLPTSLELSLMRACPDPSATAAALRAAHRDLLLSAGAGRFLHRIPAELFLGTEDHLLRVLRTGQGLLAKGPGIVIRAYEEVLDRRGVPGLLGYGPRRSAAGGGAGLVLFLGPSFVVGGALASRWEEERGGAAPA